MMSLPTRGRSPVERARLRIGPLCLALFLASCGGHPPGEGSASGRKQEEIVGLPCEGCEAVFEGLPDSLDWSAPIAPENETGDVLRIDGTIRDGEGRAVGGVIVYAYQTDARGIYPRDERFTGKAAARHGRLRAWVRTDDEGRYHFDTIRPAGYPDTNLPQHVHMHIIEPGRCTYYIDDILFDDDPRLTEALRRSMITGRGGSGLVIPSVDAEGVWQVTRDIVLGAAVPGYRELPVEHGAVMR